MRSAQRPHFFWRVGAPRALAETLVVGVALTSALMLVSDHIPPSAVGQGLLFLSLACALWCALRLRFSDEARVWQRLLREGAVALGLSLVLSVGLWAIATLVGWNTVAASANVNTANVALVFAGSGPAFLAFRIGAGLWRFWDRLRRRHLLWGLTHAHLTVVLVVTLLFALILTVQAVSYRTTDSLVPDSLAATAAVHIILTVLPILGIALVLAILLLAIVLPPSAVFSYLVARRTTRRLQALTAAARALRGGDYAARVAVAGEDEVAQLQADFNAMASDLEQAMHDLHVERDKVAGLLESQRQLIASVSHELRTPVTVVRGYLESIMAGGDRDPARLSHDLGVVEREIERLQGLIDDLFTLARAEVQGLAMDLRPVDAGMVVQRCVDAMALLAWQTGRIEVVAQVTPGLPCALADEGRLEQVLVNLLRNSVRHTSPGGVIAVVATGEENAIRIEVRDTGEGIPPQELPHVWERFYRGESARTQDDPGAGLGLALVKELVEAMGGNVGVESIVGQGSCFMLRVPKA